MNEEKYLRWTGGWSQEAYDGVKESSRRLAMNPSVGVLSVGEQIAGALVNGRLDLLPANFLDYRKAFIRLGRFESHAVIQIMHEHCEAEMALRPGEKGCPFGDQRIFYPDTGED